VRRILLFSFGRDLKDENPLFLPLFGSFAYLVPYEYDTKNRILSYTMSLDFVNLLTTLDQGLLGLTLFVAPDYFWNPADGLLPSFATKTALESNHFAAGDKVALMGSGATMLSFLIYHFFFMKSEADKRVFMRVKLFGFMAKLILFAHTAFVNESDMFNKPFFAFFTAVKLYSALMLSTALLTTKPGKEEPFTLPKGTQLAMLFSLVYTLFWASVLTFFPNTVSPNGSLPFIAKTGMEDNSFDDLQTFLIRFEGANMFCVLAFLFKMTTTPLQVDKLGDVCGLLWAFVFLKGVLDTSGLCNRKVYALQLLFHLVVTYTTSSSWGPCKVQKTVPKKAAMKKEGKPVPVPELATEKARTKKD